MIENDLEIRSYIDAVESAGAVFANANKKLADAVVAYSNLAVLVENTKHVIEGKKNNLINSGMIAGKNADERTASAWIAIPEYDKLAEQEADLIVTKNQLTVAEIEANEAKSVLSYKSLILNVLGSMHKQG